MLTAQDLDAYEVIDREPIKVSYRGREVLTNPPPSAGGILIARALSWLDARARAPPDVERIVEVMERIQAERTPEFLAGLDDPEFVERFLSARGRGRQAAARLDHPHRGARSRGLGLLGDLLQRLVLGRRRPGDRASTSTTCSASRISTRSAFTATRRDDGCPA